MAQGIGTIGRCDDVGGGAEGSLAGEPLHEVPEVGDVGLDDLRRDDVDDLYLGPRRWHGVPRCAVLVVDVLLIDVHEARAR